MKISLLLLSVMLLHSCVEIRIDDDRSRDLVSNPNKSILPFHLADVGKTLPVTRPTDIVFQEADSENMKSLLGLHRKTWIYVWGSWCSPCRKKLPQIAQIQRNNPDWNIILLADDYDIKELQKILFENRLFVQSYLLDYKKYGSKIYEKERKFWEDMATGREYSSGVPQNYMYDEKGDLLYFGSGSVPLELMEKLFASK